MLGQLLISLRGANGGAFTIAVVAALGALALAEIAVLALRPCGQVREKKGLGKVSRFMRIMVMVWTLVFVLGIAIYLYFYV